MAFEAQVYAAQLITELDSNLVARQITNDNYIEGQGRTVQVYSAGDISSSDKNADSTIDWKSTSSSQLALTMDQEKDVSVIVDVVEEFQSNPNVQNKYRERQRRAAEEDIDDFVLQEYQNAGTTLETSATSSAADFEKKVRQAKVALSDKNVPRANRFLVLTPHYADLLEEAATDRYEASDAGETARAGFIGRYQGFDIYESQRIPETGSSPTKQHMLFGHTEAVTLAVEPEEFHLIPNSQMSTHHGAGLKGLVVFGAKTFLPDALGEISADKPS
jgi:hypothetical protein